MGARVTGEPSGRGESGAPVQTAVSDMGQSGGAQAFVRLNRVLAGSVFFIRSWTSVIVSYQSQIGAACGGDIAGAAALVRPRQSLLGPLFLSCIPADSGDAIAFRGTLGLAREAPRARTMEIGTTRPTTTNSDRFLFARGLREERGRCQRLCWERAFIGSECFIGRVRARPDALVNRASPPVLQIVRIHWLRPPGRGNLDYGVDGLCRLGRFASSLVVPCASSDVCSRFRPLWRNRGIIYSRRSLRRTIPNAFVPAFVNRTP